MSIINNARDVKQIMILSAQADQLNKLLERGRITNEEYLDRFNELRRQYGLPPIAEDGAESAKWKRDEPDIGATDGRIKKVLEVWLSSNRAVSVVNMAAVKLSPSRFHICS